MKVLYRGNMGNRSWVYGDAKWKKIELVVVAAPGPINPLKAALGLSVIHSMPGAQCFFCFFF